MPLLRFTYLPFFTIEEKSINGITFLQTQTYNNKVVAN